MNSIFDYVCHQVVAADLMVFEMCDFKKDFGLWKKGDQFYLIEVSCSNNEPKITTRAMNNTINADCTNGEDFVTHPLTKEEYFEVLN